MKYRSNRARPDLVEVDPCLEYLEHLRQDRGLCPPTLSHHGRGSRDFLAFLEHREVPLNQVKLVDIDAYLFGLAEARKTRYVLQYQAIAVRGFLRFLAEEGILSRDLSRWVQGPRSYRDAAIPPAFTWSELEQLCSSVTDEDPLFLQDLAVLALLCSYGLRSQEVVGLTLNGIDWIHDRLLILQRKNGRPLILPLLEGVKVALQQYLNGRPSTAHQEVFLSRQGQPLRSAQISRRLRLLAKRAGLPGRRGAHAIRRTVGTRLVEQGWGLGEVALILGHGSIDSARVYLRISSKLLRDVALNYGELL